MPTGPIAVRGTFFDLLDDPWKYAGREPDAARFVRDGLLVVDGGLIRAFGPVDEVSSRFPDVPVTHLANRIIVPGLIDGHVHFPQARVLGAFGLQLLDWLTTWVLPEEARYADRDYAREAAGRFFDALLAVGTTTCQAFTTVHPVATEEFFAEASRHGMRTLAGLTGMDRFAPPDSLTTPETFYADSKRLIETYHRRGRNLYAITPRYAVGCSDAMLAVCARLKREHPDCWVNTHVSETPTEVQLARAAFPDGPDYTAAYEKHGLLGPKFTAGHGVWLSDGELRRFAAAGAGVCFCPLSNLFLGSGLFRLGRATDPAHRVRLSVGSDVGAGNAFSLLRVLDEAYKVGMCNRTMLDETDPAEAERNTLSAYRAFYLATLGGAHALYLDDVLGNFAIGKEADFVALDWSAGPPGLSWRQSRAAPAGGPETIDQVADLLFGLMACGDDRSVAETWIGGSLAYRRAG